jgi:ABC-type uncharacterized transport system substrate-binding protein
MVALTAKRFELLHETVPAAVDIGYLVNLTLPDVEAELKEAKIAADVLGLRLVTRMQLPRQKSKQRSRPLLGRE